MSRTVLVLASLLLGCSNSAPPPAQGQPQPGMNAAGQPVTPPPTAEPPKPALPPRPVAQRADNDAEAGSCDAASLKLATDAVVASVDGVDIKASELGADYDAAEAKALATYCNELSRLRRAAVDRAVEDKLLAAAGQAAGKDADGFLRDYVEKNAQPPSDDELRSFYDSNKREGAPDFELVRQQVERAVMEERSQKLYASLMSELKGKAQLQTMLPDVRPPAHDLDIPSHAATFGPDTATVEIVEFSDFECPYCARAATVVSEVKKRYGDQVKFAFRHFPLSFHPNAKEAAKIAFCANEQDKFWAVHDEIFAKQRELSPQTLRQAAITGGLDEGKLDDCMESGRAEDAIAEDMKTAQEVGVEGTPSFYINGRPFDGELSADGLGRAIDDEMAS